MQSEYIMRRMSVMGKAKHLIVISEDAMVYEDLAQLRQMPSFGAVMQNAAIVKTVRSVYPTILSKSY